MEEARQVADSATWRFPGNAIFQFQLGVAELNLGDRVASRRALEAAVAIDPEHPLALYRPGHDPRCGPGVGCCRRILSPGAGSRSRGGVGAGQDRQHRTAHRRSRGGDRQRGGVAGQHPSDATVLSNRLLAEQYAPGVTSERLFEVHRRWQERIAANLRPLAPPRRLAPSEADRPLRVGMVGADFRLHPTAYLSVGALERIDRGQVELVAYDCAPSDDAMAQRLRAAIRNGAKWPRGAMSASCSRWARMGLTSFSTSAGTLPATGWGCSRGGRRRCRRPGSAMWGPPGSTRWTG